MFFGSLKPPWRHLSYNEPNCQAMVACILVQLVILLNVMVLSCTRQPQCGANCCDILTWNRPIRFESCRHVIRCRTIKYCITMFRWMTHLKMTHCFTVCVWKCLLYLFFPFYLGTNGPFPMSFEVMMIPLLYFRWAAYVPSGSPESWHWQCQTM